MPINFKEWFIEKLQEKGMSAGEFAQVARISRASAYHYTEGRRVPNAAALDKLAVALNMDRAAMPAFEPRQPKTPETVIA